MTHWPRIRSNKESGYPTIPSAFTEQATKDSRSYQSNHGNPQILRPECGCCSDYGNAYTIDKPDPRTTNEITQQNYHLYDYEYHQDPKEIPPSDIQSKQWELTQEQESLRKAPDKLG